jgi:hypothetical protein
VEQTESPSSLTPFPHAPQIVSPYQDAQSRSKKRKTPQKNQNSKSQATTPFEICRRECNKDFQEKWNEGARLVAANHHLDCMKRCLESKFPHSPIHEKLVKIPNPAFSLLSLFTILLLLSNFLLYFILLRKYRLVDGVKHQEL